MSQSEDYLDSLLNSVSKAKSDITTSYEQAEEDRRERRQQRTRIAPEDDFLSANGISEEDLKPRPRRNLRKILSETDFLREFESDLELDDEDADSFIMEFEKELNEAEADFEDDAKPAPASAVDSFLDDIDSIVDDAQAKIDEEDDFDIGVESFEESPSLEMESSSEDLPSDIDLPDELMIDSFEEEKNVDDADMISDLEDISALFNDSSEDEKDTSDVESNSDESLDLPLDDLDLGPDIMDEFAPDELDAEDDELMNPKPEEAEASPLDALSDGLDLGDLFGDEGGDLADIESLLGDEDIDLEDSSDSAEADDSSDKDTKKAKKEKKEKKEKKAKGEKAAKGDSPVTGILAKLSLIFFGPDDEEEEETKSSESATDDVAPMSEDDEAFIASLTGEDAPEAEPAPPQEDPKEKKKREKEEAKKAKEAEKKAKAEEKKAKAKAKAEKPKKEKKPKEPDNSPKIPIKVIIVYLILAASIIVFVFVLTTIMGIDRHTSVALEYYEKHEYVKAYEMLNGLEIDNEEQLLLRNRSRMLADLQLKNEEGTSYYDIGEYNLSIDSLIQGVGRYNEYKADAASYDIAVEYDRLGQEIINTLYSKYGVTEDAALDIYNSRNRHTYTLAIRKILISLGLKDK